jgi:hypothetical protein
MALDALSAFAGPAALLVGAVTSVLNWWETRERRKFDEARFEESRRVPWTYEMLNRWAAVHQGNDGLDLVASHFLSREALATLDVVAKDSKISIPQALLYDLELVRAAVSSARELLGAQFELMGRTQIPAPNGDIPVPLNYSWLRKWTIDPAIDWAAAVANKNSKEFSAELRQMARSPSEIAKLAFVPDVVENNSAKRGPSADQLAWMARATRLFVATTYPSVVLGAAAAGLLYLEYATNKELARRDDFRELLLLSAEVERVRLLHSVMRAVEALTLTDSNRRMILLEEGRNLKLAQMDVSTLEVVALGSEMSSILPEGPSPLLLPASAFSSSEE